VNLPIIKLNYKLSMPDKLTLHTREGCVKSLPVILLCDYLKLDFKLKI